MSSVPSLPTYCQVVGTSSELAAPPSGPSQESGHSELGLSEGTGDSQGKRDPPHTQNRQHLEAFRELFLPCMYRKESPPQSRCNTRADNVTPSLRVVKAQCELLQGSYFVETATNKTGPDVTLRNLEGSVDAHLRWSGRLDRPLDATIVCGWRLLQLDVSVREPGQAIKLACVSRGEMKGTPVPDMELTLFPACNQGR